ncbi:MAG: hypothetical protein ACRD4Q_01190 [Candidatus Acidiferrales bacterium]
MPEELEAKNMKVFLELLAIGVAVGVLMVLAENYLLKPAGL